MDGALAGAVRYLSRAHHVRDVRNIAYHLLRFAAAGGPLGTTICGMAAPILAGPAWTPRLTPMTSTRPWMIGALDGQGRLPFRSSQAISDKKSLILTASGSTLRRR